MVTKSSSKSHATIMLAAYLFLRIGAAVILARAERR
jgi:hypothetical protein